MDNPTTSYLKDFEAVLFILEVAVKNHLNNLANRVSYHSIEIKNLGTELKLDRESRREIFLFLAIYGTPLGVANLLFVPQLGMPPLPVTLFQLLMFIASSDAVATNVYVQTCSALRGLMSQVEHNDVDIKDLKALLSTAYLDKVYAD